MSENYKEPEKTILIAEDEDISYLFLCNILKKALYNVIRAKNGQEAVNICLENTDINLVLMDINMPVMNGFEATTIIKKIRHDLPVIAVTAYTLNNTELQAKNAGCDDYLPKPVMRDLLLLTVSRFIKE